MEEYGGVKAQIYVFLTSALYEGTLSASCPGRFMPGNPWNAWNPWYPLNRSASEFLSEYYGGNKYLLLLPAINQTFCFPAHSPVTTLTSPQTTSVCTLHFHEKNVHLKLLCKKYVSNLYFNFHPCSQSPRVVPTNSFCVQSWCLVGGIAASLNRFPNMKSKNTSIKNVIHDVQLSVTL
jgi:hypothetical protein